MKVLLISTYELGHQPLGLVSPAAFLLDAGNQVACHDLSVEPLDRVKVLEASFVGISIPMHTAMRLGIKVAEQVRNINQGCHLCFYGLYASLNAEYLLGRIADSVIGGEYEIPLKNLVSYLDGKMEEFPEGVSSKTRSALPYLGRQQFLTPIRTLVPPLDRYAHLQTGIQTRKVGAVEASRGCAHRCLHCPITPVYEGRMRIVQAEVVLDDIDQLVEMGASHITFTDPDFLNGIEHSLSIIHPMHDRHPQLTFDMTAKIEHLVKYADLIPGLKKQGCVFIQSAVEILNNRILAFLEKGHTKADVFSALESTRKAGVALRPSLVPFTPWTSLEDYWEILDFVESQELVYHIEPIQFAIRLLLPPGSSLLSSPHLEPWLGDLDQEKFSYQWEYMDERVGEIAREVTRIVEGAARTMEDEMDTFHKIWEVGLTAIHGESGSVRGRPKISQRDRPARLTESWFCCAEPTQEHYLPIQVDNQKMNS